MTDADEPTSAHWTPADRIPADRIPADRIPADRTPADRTAADRTTAGLSADCGNCFGLCCVAPAFVASTDFAVTKPAGRACLNLQSDFRCGIHTQLRDRGFRGCTVYDCFGAGQKVSQVTFDGRDWRQAPESAGQMFEVFPIVRQVHELLWLLAEALRLTNPADVGLRGEIEQAFDDAELLTRQPAERLLAVDVAEHRAAVGGLLRRASERLRGGTGRPTKDLSGADLVGADLADADLRGANLRGTLLVAADLRGADLRTADLTGADVRDADLSGADLTGSIFLTQAQLDAARGDAATTVPAPLTRPSHWATSAADRAPRSSRSRASRPARRGRRSP